MLYESLDSLGYLKKKKRKKTYHHSWIMGLPFRMRFKKSGLYISIIPPLIVGFVVGILASIMGVGGGFIMIPAMIYIIRMPTSVVIGTSLYQIIFVITIFLFLPKWILSFIYFDEDITLRIISEVSDTTYFPLIKYLLVPIS